MSRRSTSLCAKTTSERFCHIVSHALEAMLRRGVSKAARRRENRTREPMERFPASSSITCATSDCSRWKRRYAARAFYQPSVWVCAIVAALLNLRLPISWYSINSPSQIPRRMLIPITIPMEYRTSSSTARRSCKTEKRRVHEPEECYGKDETSSSLRLFPPACFGVITTKKQQGG